MTANTEGTRSGRAKPYSLTTTEADPPIIHRQYSNPEVDRLLELGRTVSVDFDERLVYYTQAQELMWEDSSLIPLWTIRQATATRDTISGFEPDPSGRLRLDVTTKSQ